MEDENENKYHGYLILPRQIKHLRKELGPTLFLFYIDLALQARWSRRYKKTFCKIMMTQEELAKELSINQGTVSKKLKALEECKSVISKTRSITVCYLPLFKYDVASQMHSIDYADWNEVYADMYRINAELQEKYDKSHNKGTQKSPLSINTSSKVSAYLNPNGEDIGLDDLDGIEKGIEQMIRDREAQNKV